MKEVPQPPPHVVLLGRVDQYHDTSENRAPRSREIFGAAEKSSGIIAFNVAD